MNTAFAISEIKRTFRNKRYLIFSLAMPILLLLVFGGQSDKIGDLDAAPFFMVSMATFGAMGSIYSRGGSVALDRSIGWNRQLRLTSLTGRQYVFGKLMTGVAIATPSIIVVFAISGLVYDVHLSAAKWLESGAAILVTLIPLGVFGVAIGYLARPDSLQAIAGGLYTLLSLLGGIWYPISEMPNWMESIARGLPMTWSTEAGRDVLSGHWVGWTGTGVLVGWTIVLGLLAAWGYRRDTYRV